MHGGVAAHNPHSNGKDKTISGTAGSHVEPAKQLTEFVVYLVRKNKGANRNIPPPGLSDPSVMSSAFFLLLSLLQPYMEGKPGHEGGLSSFPAGAMFLGVST